MCIYFSIKFNDSINFVFLSQKQEHFKRFFFAVFFLNKKYGMTSCSACFSFVIFWNLYNIIFFYVTKGRRALLLITLYQQNCFYILPANKLTIDLLSLKQFCLYVNLIISSISSILTLCTHDESVCVCVYFQVDVNNFLVSTV